MAQTSNFHVHVLASSVPKIDVELQDRRCLKQRLKSFAATCFRNDSPVGVIPSEVGVVATDLLLERAGTASYSLSFLEPSQFLQLSKFRTGCIGQRKLCQVRRPLSKIAWIMRSDRRSCVKVMRVLLSTCRDLQDSRPHTTSILADILFHRNRSPSSAEMLKDGSTVCKDLVLFVGASGLMSNMPRCFFKLS